MQNYNQVIVDSLSAEKTLALKLDKAFNGVGKDVDKQLGRIQDGAIRLTWYSSCIFDNYQNVCSKLKDEDVRFMLGVYQLIKRHDLILDMVQLYIEHRMSYFSEQDIAKIIRALTYTGNKISASQLTNRSLAYAISRTISRGFSMFQVITFKTSLTASTLLGAYGVIQEAAESADRLLIMDTRYYSILRHEGLEMMYFLIEPVFKRVSFPSSNLNNTIKDLKELLRSS